MVADGVFGPERKKSQGRTRWRLVDETLGHELDISSMFCSPVRSKALKRTADADKEEWDVLDGDNLPPPGSMRSCDVVMEMDHKREKRAIRKQPVRPRSAIKPMGGMIAFVKQTPKAVIDSPARSTRSISSSPLTTRSPKGKPLCTPKLNHSTPPRGPSPRLTAKKRNASEDLDPARKARKINYVGARRSVLQS